MAKASEQLGLPVAVLERTMLTVVKLRQMKAQLARLDADGIGGAIVECGVYRGGSAAALGLFSPERDLWLYDSFEGLPQPTEKDIGPRKLSPAKDGERDVAKLVRAPGEPLAAIGHCAASLDDVVAFLFDDLGFSQERVTIAPGWFQDTVAEMRPAQIAFLHLDGDWYESTKVCLEAFWPRLVPGGVLAVDDYDWWVGCKRALMEFLHDLPREKPGDLVLKSHVTVGSGRYMVKR